MDIKDLSKVKHFQISYSDGVLALENYTRLIGDPLDTFSQTYMNKVTMDIGTAVLTHNTDDIATPLLAKIIVNLNCTDNNLRYITHGQSKFCTIDCDVGSRVDVRVVCIDSDVTENIIGLWIDHNHQLAWIVTYRNILSIHFPKRTKYLTWFGIERVVAESQSNTQDYYAHIQWDANNCRYYASQNDMWIKSADRVRAELKAGVTAGYITPDFVNFIKRNTTPLLFFDKCESIILAQVHALELIHSTNWTRLDTETLRRYYLILQSLPFLDKLNTIAKIECGLYSSDFNGYKNVSLDYLFDTP